ncbi:MAG TPA: type II secretion system protein GspD, partial [Polyangiaceae bacterium]|nr:type II secretion system protein GspD [Polyangiaceae bacterium]
FIFGGKLRSIKATIISPKDVSAAEAYQAFLSVLETNGMTVVPHGRYLKIVETKGAQSQTTPILGTVEPVPYTDRYVTRLYRLKHVDAGEVSNILGKFKSADADITVYPPSNLLIITDTGANIRRQLRIVEELDAGQAGSQIYLQPVHNAAAGDIAATLNEMLEGSQAKILPEERSNSLVIVANENDYGRILDLLKAVDTPLDGGDDQIHVLPLQHARCDELQTTLSSILGGGGGAARRPTGAAGRAGGRTATPAAGGTASAEGGEIFEGNVRVNCDEATNALVAVSSLRDYAQLRNVIDKLDKPRRQVFIEAVIMDVNVDHTNDTGVAFHGGATADLGGGGDTIFYGGSNPQQSLTGLPATLEALAFGVRGPDLDGTEDLLGTGLSIPAFGVVLHALARSGDSNVLATPHILATDNIAAEISIGQNIPLQTNIGGGNLSQLAGLAGGQAGGLGALGGLGGLVGGLGFQAPRQDVGIRLNITPHINDSNQVRMEIQEEFSDAGSPTGALGAVPINKRTANTTIIVEDQQTVVIGGLVRESQVNGETKIPVLGDIPVLGVLFRQSTKQTQKTNLLLILTPHIIRSQNDLRRIFERKMQERQEFLDRYFVFEESLPWEPAKDYSRTNGLLEHIRQTQLSLAERERLAESLQPLEDKVHEPVKPLQMPAMAQPKSSSTGAAKPAPKPAPRPRPRSRTTRGTRSGQVRPNFRLPGGMRSPSNRYRIE